ncbi:50S ribosomal protein L23 [Candidatus Parcubacteria bacterium]|nr:50S ribosomal protein L23 [Candidatus Parcubacteria bacterium]
MTDKIIEKKSVLIRPRLSEKAIVGADKNRAYVFEVSPDATKSQIAASVKAAYKVVPVKVRTARIADKAVFVRGKHGTRRGGKKAYVYLKKGDKIELI